LGDGFTTLFLSEAQASRLADALAEMLDSSAWVGQEATT